MSADWKTSTLAGLAAIFIKGIHATLRIREVGVANIEDMNAAGKPYIFAFWHSQLLTLMASRYGRPVSVLVSQHRDGELVTRAAHHFGIDAARGSSTRGATAGLREMIKVAQSGASLAITPDGPKGPARVAKPGAVLAARATGLPIITAACSLKKKSSSAPGISSSSPGRSAGLCFSMARRSTCPAS